MASPLSDKVKDILLEWAQEMSDEMSESLSKSGHVDYSGAGSLYQAATISPEWIKDEEGDAFRLKVILPFYAAYLNDGTRPSIKNPSPAFIDSLSGSTGWIAKKGIAISTSRTFMAHVKGKAVKRTVTFKNKAEANKSFAWAIARKRLRNGSPATHWFDEVWGNHPVPENSPAVERLKKSLSKLASNSQFFIDIIDPNKPE